MKLGQVVSSGQRAPSEAGRVTVPRVAVVGCGAVCEKHLAALAKVPRIRVVGVCDRDRQAALGMARRFGVEAVYDAVHDLFDGSRPDVVHVLTPPATHAPLSILAMEAGAHVLVEKPMAADVGEAEAMIAAARRHGVVLCVAHNFLFEPGLLKARELVARGAVGRLVAVEIYWRVRHERLRHIRWFGDLRGGVFHEVAPHPVYVLGAFLQSPRVVSAVVSETAGDLGPDELRVSLAARTGLATLAIATSAHPHQIWLRIYGSRSSLLLDLTTNTLVRLGAGNEGRLHKLVRNLSHGAQLSMGTAANAARFLGGRTTTGRQRLIEAFYASLENGTGPPVSGEQGLETVATLEAIWEALDR